MSIKELLITTLRQRANHNSLRIALTPEIIEREAARMAAMPWPVGRDAFIAAVRDEISNTEKRLLAA